jgi:hypothetical protein
LAPPTRSDETSGCCGPSETKRHKRNETKQKSERFANERMNLKNMAAVLNDRTETGPENKHCFSVVVKICDLNMAYKINYDGL